MAGGPIARCAISIKDICFGFPPKKNEGGALSNPGERMEQLLDQALALDASERTAFVMRACGADAQSRERLLRMLAAATTGSGFLDRPVLRTADPPSELTGVTAAGRCIGAFRLTRRLGAGGMGEVWLAERVHGDFTQRVALKLMLPGVGTDPQRFVFERRILAELDHPGIARLYDGGVSDDGAPWMAMEYVEGQDLLSWVREHRADLQTRLELFVQVCEAVAYAHAHLVVHRDLKPANIFVTRAGTVKLLDFGIAKLLVPQAASDATRTMHLSPAYAAPEQLDGGPITTATDVFSLGVTLYHVLANYLPWNMDSAPLGSALKRMLGDVPPPPSRATDGTIGERALRGDLDAITAKALRHDPQARYPDARAMAEDLRRYLRREPIQAREGARAYVVRRLLRRHWLPVSAAVALVAALASGFAGVVWQARRAEQEAARAAATRDFLVDIFKASDPRLEQDKPRGEITARELLDASVDRIEQEFAHDMPTQLELLRVSAEIYRELGENERYERLHALLLTIARKHYGASHPFVLGALLDEASYAKDRFDSPRALQLLDELDPLIRSEGLDRTSLRARWWLTRGQALFEDSSRIDELIAALRNATDLFAAVAPTDPGRVTALADLGTAHSNRMDFGPAQRYLRQSIAAADSVSDRNDAELATIYGNLGLISQSMGDFAAADQAYARAEEIIRRTHGESRPHHWVPAASRARAAHLGGDRMRSWTLFEKLLQQIPRDSTHHEAIEAREWYGGCLAAEGRATEALPLLEAAERAYQDTYLYDYQLPRVRAVLGDAYDRAGRTEEARRMLQAALNQRVANDPPQSQPVLAIRERWGRFLLTHGDIAGAEAQFQEVVQQAHGRKLAHVALAYGGLARVALRKADVGAALAGSTKAIETFETVSGFRDVRMGPYLWLIHSEVLRQSGAGSGARQWAIRALDASRRYDAPIAASIAEAEAAVRAADARATRSD